jgi:hypothetical protein
VLTAWEGFDKMRLGTSEEGGGGGEMVVDAKLGQAGD